MNKRSGMQRNRRRTSMSVDHVALSLAVIVVAHPVPWTQDKTYAAAFS